MGFVLRLIGNTVYSLIHTVLICFLVLGIGYVITLICTLPLWLCIIALLFSLGLIEYIRNLLTGLMTIPYSMISGRRGATVFLAVIVQVLNAFWLIYKIWWDMPLFIGGIKGIILGIYLTCQTCIVTGMSIYGTNAASEN